MTINRANQTWPEEMWERVANKIQGRLIAQLPRDAQAKEIERLDIYKKYAPEPLDEFERRQRGSAPVVAVAVIVVMFVLFAVAVMPLINALGRMQ